MSSVSEQPDRLDYNFSYSLAEARAIFLPVRRSFWMLGGGALAIAIVLTVIVGFLGTVDVPVVGVLVAAVLVAYVRLATLPRKVIAAADGRPVHWRVGPEGVEVETAAGSATIDWGKVVWVWLTPSALTLRRRDPAVRFSLPRRAMGPSDPAIIAYWVLQAGVRRKGAWPGTPAKRR